MVGLRLPRRRGWPRSVIEELESRIGTSRLEIKAFDKLAGFLGAVVALHAGILPFDGEGALVANHIQATHDRLPVDAAMPGRAKIPTSPWIALRQIGIEQTASPVERESCVFHVYMVNAVRKAPQKLNR